MDTAQWPQGNENENSKPVGKKPRPKKEQALNCPRCNSTNTKFCYYNNYSLSQPRYFCKTCRRYWTEGGSLRNVPVGGGSRRNKRSSSAAAPSTSKKIINDLNPPQNPRTEQGHDLNFSYNAMSEFVTLHQNLSNHHHHHHNLPLMELLKTGDMSGGGAVGGLSSFMSVPISDAATTSLNFSVDGYGNQTNQSSRSLFPFEELKQVPSNDQFAQERVEGETNGYWNGMLAGGSW